MSCNIEFAAFSVMPVTLVPMLLPMVVRTVLAPSLVIEPLMLRELPESVILLVVPALFRTRLPVPLTVPLRVKVLLVELLLQV